MYHTRLDLTNVHKSSGRGELLSFDRSEGQSKEMWLFIYILIATKS